MTLLPTLTSFLILELLVKVSGLSPFFLAPFPLSRLRTLSPILLSKRQIFSGKGLLRRVLKYASETYFPPSFFPFSVGPELSDNVGVLES